MVWIYNKKPTAAAAFTFDFLPMYVWANQSESIAFRFAIIWPWKTQKIYIRSYHRYQTEQTLISTDSKVLSGAGCEVDQSYHSPHLLKH